MLYGNITAKELTRKINKAIEVGISKDSKYTLIFGAIFRHTRMVRLIWWSSNNRNDSH